jgi:hypothetical protein
MCIKCKANKAYVQSQKHKKCVVSPMLHIPALTLLHTAYLDATNGLSVPTNSRTYLSFGDGRGEPHVYTAEPCL